MSPIYTAVLLLAAPPDSGAEQQPARRPIDTASASAEEKTPARIAHELRKKVSKHLRWEATTDGTENELAVRALVGVFRELMVDETLARDERKRLVAKVRGRLSRVAERMEKQHPENPLATAPNPLPERLGPREYIGSILGQRMNQLGQGLGRAAGAKPGEALLDLIQATIVPGSWEDQGGPGVIRIFPGVGVLHQQLGGVVGAGQAVPAGRGGQAQMDHGDDLVELIQTTIAPESWDVNGGPGTIYYFRGLRVLVIRQTSEVHGQVGDVVGQLRGN